MGRSKGQQMVMQSDAAAFRDELPEGAVPVVELEFRRMRDDQTYLCAVADIEGMGRVVLVHSPVKPRATVASAVATLNRVHLLAREQLAKFL